VPGFGSARRGDGGEQGRDKDAAQGRNTPDFGNSGMRSD
jgi:hypothetical protein